MFLHSAVVQKVAEMRIPFWIGIWMKRTSLFFYLFFFWVFGIQHFLVHRRNRKGRISHQWRCKNTMRKAKKSHRKISKRIPWDRCVGTDGSVMSVGHPCCHFLCQGFLNPAGPWYAYGLSSKELGLMDVIFARNQMQNLIGNLITWSISIDCHRLPSFPWYFHDIPMMGRSCSPFQMGSGGFPGAEIVVASSIAWEWQAPRTRGGSVGRGFRNFSEKSLGGFPKIPWRSGKLYRWILYGYFNPSVFWY